MQRSIPILWGLVIILLILNLVLLDALNLARLTAVETLSKVETMLDGLANEVIVYNIDVNQAVPVNVEVPFNRTMDIPLNTVIHVDQELTVPFQTPAGEVMLDVPIQTDVPIDTVIPVDFNQAINVDTVVQLNTTLPVEIDIAQTPLAGYLRQAKSDIAQLRRRLALQGEAAEEEAVVVGSDSETSASSATAPVSKSQSQAPSVESEGIALPVTEPAPESSAPEKIQDQPTDLTLSSGIAADQVNLGLCTHPYWPLWPDTEWTYNSFHTSYTQRVDNLISSQVDLSTQYEGRDIQFSLTCSQEGLGGTYLGDMRRITELGDLDFGNPRGVFLPHPETMEQIGVSWRQELDVTGTVLASHGDGLVEGRIRRGRALAVYTPVRFESVETPLGPRQALRVEQRLDFELDIDFDLEGQKTPATEAVNLSTIYWFARDIGLVKMHWQGGTIQQSVEIDHIPVNQQSSIPALVEDQLVFVCVTLTDQSIKCTRMAGISEFDLTALPESELEIQSFVFSSAVGSEDSPGIAETSAAEVPREPVREDDGQSDFLAYAAAVESLIEQLSEAAEVFWEAALKFRDDQLTFDEFRQKFLEFAPKVRALIQEINRLSPPPEAEAIHQKLTSGMAKCDQSVDLMDAWFDTPDSDTKEAAALLVAECVEDVTAAGDELRELAGGD